MKNSLFIIALLVVASVSCDSGRTIPSVETGNEKATSLTFEDTVRFHTQKYCNCFGEFNVFVEKAKTMHPDSVDMEMYGKLQGESANCFDPNGVISAFGKSLDSTKRIKQKELFSKYRQEICPEIISKG
ncbi:MAG: hypothetical protein ACI95T_000992 [Flavobacteriales bacterium]|jgi:hypothetical protein|tara:strand:+ start:16766 stop:17152 length:387 start_codon:yes stop_codon:yes gene_type:complete